MSVGPLEPKFFVEMLTKLGLEAHLNDQNAPERWDALAAVLQRTFLREDQAHWSAMFDGSDACVSPVLAVDASAEHAHLKARQTFVEMDGLMQAAPAPRFSRTPGVIQGKESGSELLARWGVITENTPVL